MNLGTTGGGQTPLLGVGLIVAVSLIVLLMRNQRPRPLRIEQLWIRPVIYLCLVGLTLAQSPPPLQPFALTIMAVGLAAGAAVGWQRGRFVRIEVDAQTHAVTARASPLGMALILVILFARIGLRGALSAARPVSGIPAAALTDALIVLIGAMIVTQSLEMCLRARRLLAQARAAAPASA